jgi:hypothetical protein
MSLQVRVVLEEGDITHVKAFDLRDYQSITKMIAEVRTWIKRFSIVEDRVD